MTFNLFLWCDEKISQLKEAGIRIENGVAVLPEYAVYKGHVSMISTFKYRKDIADELKSTSLLCNFMPDENLFIRLKKIDKDIKIMEGYGGICGQDLSPSIGMLKPRQRFSILINSVYNCYVAIYGIKVLPNSRIGDMGTLSMINSFPQNVSFISGMHGCKNHGFKEYGLYQLRMIVREKKPPILYIYGSLTCKEARRLFWCNEFVIVAFPDRRNRVRNGNKSYAFYFDGNDIKKVPYEEYMIGSVAEWE